MITTYMSMPVCCLLLFPGPAFPVQDHPSTGRRQAEKSISLEVGAAPQEVLALFGPVRESDWSPTWKPNYIYPDAGSNTQEGTVFTIGGADGRISVWILVEYSTQRKTVRYAVVSPDATTTEIWVRLFPKPGKRTRVLVTQRRTSLRAETDEFITHFEQHFPGEARHWQQAIEGYLRSRPGR